MYAEPVVCILRLDEDEAGATDLTAIGATNAEEEAMRVTAVLCNICYVVVDIVLILLIRGSILVNREEESGARR